MHASDWPSEGIALNDRSCARRRIHSTRTRGRTAVLSGGRVLERADGIDEISSLYTNKIEFADHGLDRGREGLCAPIKLGERSVSGSCGRDARRGRRPRSCGPSRLKSSRRRHLELAESLLHLGVLRPELIAEARGHSVELAAQLCIERVVIGFSIRPKLRRHRLGRGKAHIHLVETLEDPAE